ncbi:hypothetical protein BDW74DRAFT_179151 [Aspergillus multicolor]|uniref:uncharacterized protein n=1 Tax=Aspergillus multicolor TaxID=41759 RepID=UPI003CCD1395
MSSSTSTSRRRQSRPNLTSRRSRTQVRTTNWSVYAAPTHNINQQIGEDIYPNPTIPGVILLFRAHEPVISRVIYLQSEIPSEHRETTVRYKGFLTEGTKEILRTGTFRNSVWLGDFAEREMSFDEADLRALWMKMVIEGGMDVDLRLEDTERLAGQEWKTLLESDFLAILAEVQRRGFLVSLPSQNCPPFQSNSHDDGDDTDLPANAADSSSSNQNNDQTQNQNQFQLADLAQQLKRAFDDFWWVGEHMDIRAFEVRVQPIPPSAAEGDVAGSIVDSIPWHEYVHEKYL